MEKPVDCPHPPTYMEDTSRPLVIVTRGSALALAQARDVMARARLVMPGRGFEMKVVKTTGDHLQTASMANPEGNLPKGLFTKELEVELASGGGDLAVHSLKDLPTELPEGMELAGVLPRADVREVMVYRDAAMVAKRPGLVEWSPGMRLLRGFGPGLTLKKLPQGAVLATSSTRRAALLRLKRPDLGMVTIRGNVGTRLAKVAEDAAFDATLLAAAGLVRLGMFLGPKGRLMLDPVLPAGHGHAPPPEGLFGVLLEPEDLLPAVGQGAIGLEIRSDNVAARELARLLTHGNTERAVTAERAFLRGVGGGCQSPIAAHARVLGHQLHLRASVLTGDRWWHGEARRPMREAAELGCELAAEFGRAG
jgi:hydroxymethylbilane synthase